MRSRDPRRVFLLLSGAEEGLYSLVFVATMVYMVTAGLTPLELILVGTALEGTVFVSEVPTGIVADRKGRRISVLIGFLIIGCAFTLMGSLPRLWVFLATSAMWGFGYTFTSGAVEAWLVDEVGQEQAEPLFARGAKVGAICGIAGTLAGMGVGSIAIALPVLIGGIGFVGLAAYLAAFMPENPAGRSVNGARSGAEGPLSTARRGFAAIRGHAVLFALLVVAVLLGAQSESLDRFRDAHLIRTVGVPGLFAPVVWIGALGMLVRAISAGGNHILEKRIGRIRRPGIPLAVMTTAMAGAVVLFSFAGGFVGAAVALTLAGALRGVSAPLALAWMNRHIRSDIRATVLSMYGQADAVGQIAIGPIFGVLGNRLGLPLAMTIGVAFLVPAVVLYLGTARR